MPVRLEITFLGTRPHAPLRRWLTRYLHRALPRLRQKRGSLNIAIVSDAQMRRLHRRHMNLASTTDVLSFDLRERPRAPMELELALCIDQARRQARRRRHTLRLELLLYALHGLLHTLGYDDHHPRDAQRMHAREDELLRALGLPGVYYGQASDRRRARSVPRR